MSDVFISHVEEDMEVALEIARGLEASGYTAWSYERDTYPGLDYLDQVQKALEESHAVIILISPAALDSRQVEDEVKWAREQGKPFVPILNGITWSEFQNRRPRWRMALGIAAAVSIAAGGIGSIIPRIVRGLEELGVKPRASQKLQTPPQPPQGARDDPTGPSDPAPEERVETRALASEPKQRSPLATAGDDKAERFREIFENPAGMIGLSIGPYQLVQFIGSGGSGIVFRAVQSLLGRTAALKVFYPLRGPLSRFYELFERGFRALGALDHPHIAKVLDFGNAEVRGLPLPYTSVEYVRGVALDEWSRKLGRQPDARKLRVRAALELAEALSAAHETTYTDQLGFEARGLLHGDLKPANVLVTDRGEVKLLDFLLIDLQRLQDPRVVPPQCRLGRGQEQPITAAFGTPGFMAPEQECQGLVTVKTDIFGLGVTLSCLFAPEARGALPALLCDDALPKALRNLVSQMTAESPAMRPPSMRVVVDRLNIIYQTTYDERGLFYKARSWVRGDR